MKLAILVAALAPTLPLVAETSFRITPGDIPNDGITFVDYSRKNRSGHMGHALVEYARDSLLAFYSNASGCLNHGHTGYGWMEYRRSTDGGKTWGEPKVLDYSRAVFLDGTGNISCEKAEVTDKGTIVLFCQRNKCLTGWDPYLEPMVLRSSDAGETWSGPIPFSGQRGRVYATLYRDGRIYALQFLNDSENKWCGNKPEHVYKLYVSDDDGLTFSERSTLPFDTTGRAYGALAWLPDDRLIAYAYNVNDEFNMDYVVSADRGRSWSEPKKSFCAKRIRNPQVFCLKGLYFLHGRSGNEDRRWPFNFVLYTSQNGIDWDEGRFLRVTAPNEWGTHSYYSNNLVLGRFGGPIRALIQASVPYSEARENVAHWWIEAVLL